MGLFENRENEIITTVAERILLGIFLQEGEQENYY